jgi:hypothetical protein
MALLPVPSTKGIRTGRPTGTGKPARRIGGGTPLRPQLQAISGKEEDMNRIAGSFMKAAVVYGVVGLTLGVYMGATQKLALLTVHSHLSLLGWVTLSLCAMYYQLVPGAADGVVPKIHFWSANIGLIVLAASLVLKARGVSAAEAGAGIGSVLSLAALAMFLVVVFRTSGAKAS